MGTCKSDGKTVRDMTFDVPGVVMGMMSACFLFEKKPETQTVKLKARRKLAETQSKTSEG
jgi:hypothetical protein